jgi:transcriptional regulator with XRE-family HTH domain
MNDKRTADALPAIRPGAKLKALRVKRGWSLAEISRRTGLPISSLSKVENDKMELTLDKLLRIGTALETDLAHLVAPLSAPEIQNVSAGRRTITRAGEGKVLEGAAGRYRYLANDLLNKLSLPMVIEVTAHSLEEFGELNHHLGEEFLFVLDGELDFYSSIYMPVNLKNGDSMYFDGNMGHAYVAVGQSPCRILSVCVAPGAPDAFKLPEHTHALVRGEPKPAEQTKRVPHHQKGE